MAEQGVPVAGSLAAANAAAEADGGLAADEGMAAVLRPGGRPLQTDDALVQPALARTLRAIQVDGPAALYEGPVGAAIVAHLRALGSAITTDDLAAHATELGEPLTGVFGDEEVLTAPPNSQGLLLLEILNAATRLGDVDLLGEDADLLAELFRLVTLDRDRHLADPRRADVPVAELLSDRHAAELAEAALARRSAGRGAAGQAGARATGDTIAVVAADGAGNAVSLIQSIYYGFGSGILDPTTGVILHNRGAFFSVDEASPNVLAGGKRPGHTLMPVLVRRAGRLVGVHGTMGGSAQAQIHAQLILRTARGEAPADVLAAPRFVVGGLEPGGRADLVLAEPGCAAAEQAWAAAGHDVHRLGELDEETGHAQLIRIGGDGSLRAASDPRADGAALAG
jgi:gamma-glutamyltranspeptidase/glutathione hydrolase